MRALISARPTLLDEGRLELVHVELASDGGVVACDGPSCANCSKHIVDCGFVVGVWLYEAMRINDALVITGDPVAKTMRAVGEWRRYTAADFHRVTIERQTKTPPR
jgi:hypothetical protein